MAKKKETVQEIVMKEPQRNGDRKIDWPEAHNLLVDKIEAIEQRIDRIVAAIHKSKSVFGL